MTLPVVTRQNSIWRETTHALLLRHRRSNHEHRSEGDLLCVRTGARLKWLVRRVMINRQTHVLLLPLAPQVTRSGGSSREIVPMMKTAKSRHGYDFATCFGIFESLTPGWSFLGKCEVGAVFVVVTDVLIHEASQMQFVERNHMVEQIALPMQTNRSATPFYHGLLKLVRCGLMPRLITAAITPSLKFAPRSKIKYLGEESQGYASRNC